MKNRRACGLPGIGACLVLGAGCSGQNEASAPIAAVQDFQVPVLSGWKKGGTDGKSVSFTKEVQGNKVVLKLMCDRTKKGARLPKTTADLVREAQRDREIMAPSAKRLSIQFQKLADQPSQFQGMPAVISEVTSTSPRGTVRSKTLRFTNGQNLYLMSWVMSSPPGVSASPEAQSEAAAGWKILSEGTKAR